MCCWASLSERAASVSSPTARIANFWGLAAGCLTGCTANIRLADLSAFVDDLRRPQRLDLP